MLAGARRMRRPWVLLVAVLILATGCGSPRAGSSTAATERDRSEVAVDRLLDLLAERLAIMPLVAKAKWNAALPVEDAERERALLDDMRARARSRRLPGDWVETVFRAQIEAGKDIQRALIVGWTAAGIPPFADAPDLRGELRPRIDALNGAILDVLGEVMPVLDRRSVQARLRERGPSRLGSRDVSAEIAARALAPFTRAPPGRSGARTQRAELSGSLRVTSLDASMADEVRSGPWFAIGYGARVAPKRESEPPPIPEPVEPRALDAALRLFVAGFVVDDKQAQLHKRLLTSGRRGETLAALPRWLAVVAAPLEGADRSPAGLRARLGDLAGIRVAEDGAGRTTVARALELGRGVASLFIADSGTAALITAPGTPPLLCSRLGARR